MTDTFSFDKRTDAAIESLVDFYLTQPVTSDSEDTGNADNTDNKSALGTPDIQATTTTEPLGLSPIEQSNDPVVLPTDSIITTHSKQNHPDESIPPLAAANVEAVLIGHLPGYANTWLGQYADARLTDFEIVAICHLRAGEVEIELVRRGKQGQVSPAHTTHTIPDRNLEDVLAELNTRVGLWLINLPEPTSPPARSAFGCIPTWTLLTGGDEAAIVGAYRLLKSASQPMTQQQGLPKRINIMFMGCNQSAAEKAIEKITGAVRSFLKLDSRLVGVRQRIEPINKTSIGSFANNDQSHSEPNWASLLRFVTEQVEEETAFAIISPDLADDLTTHKKTETIEIIENIENIENEFEFSPVDTITPGLEQHMGTGIDLDALIEEFEQYEKYEKVSDDVLAAEAKRFGLDVDGSKEVEIGHDGRDAHPTINTHPETDVQSTTRDVDEVNTHDESLADEPIDDLFIDGRIDELLVDEPIDEVFTGGAAVDHSEIDADSNESVAATDDGRDAHPTDSLASETAIPLQESNKTIQPKLNLLSNFIEALVGLPIQCPLCSTIELAYDADGRLHLLGQYNDDQVTTGLSELLLAQSWAKSHSPLIAQACSPTKIDPTLEPVVHLFTDSPKPLLPLIVQGDTPIKLHLLKEVKVGHESVYDETTLN